MDVKKNKSFAGQFYTLYHWLQKGKKNINAEMIKRFGPGYENRPISGGPIKNMNFFAPKRFVGSKHFWNGSFDEELFEYMRKSIRPDAVCYDIGSESGYNALVMAQTAKKGRVYAFEPLLQRCDLLRINIHINRQENIAVVPKAVAAAEGKIRLEINYPVERSAFNIAAEDGTIRHPEQCVECDAVTLDDFVIEGHLPPDVVRINADTWEKDVLQGASRVLKEHHPVIICDTHNAEEARSIYEILCENNYELYVVKDGMWPVFSPQDMPGNPSEGHILAKH